MEPEKKRNEVKITFLETLESIALAMKELLDRGLDMEGGPVTDQTFIAFVMLLREMRKGDWSQIIPADGWYAVHRKKDKSPERTKLICWGLKTENRAQEYTGAIQGAIDVDGYIDSPQDDANFVGYYHESEDWEAWKRSFMDEA